MGRPTLLQASSGGPIRYITASASNMLSYRLQCHRMGRIVAQLAPKQAQLTLGNWKKNSMRRCRKPLLCDTASDCCRVDLYSHLTDGETNLPISRLRLARHRLASGFPATAPQPRTPPHKLGWKPKSDSPSVLHAPLTGLFAILHRCQFQLSISSAVACSQTPSIYRNSQEELLR
ncbi:hypothetical protein PAHAL_2G480000 [Panicum hallii]|uniref:Uncharacterized protein n=1 Tax=Panicum hallii TaxID=206008 RepID=A0A2T8KT84_9POAL|nr:hypothetical protein PAHAL_2G480000 [Panicum hallii]